MIGVFELLNQQSVKTFHPGQLTQLRNNAELNLKNIKAMYRNSVRIVPSDHILIQILQHLPFRTELNDEEYYRFCHSASKLTHRALNLNTSTVLSGKSAKPYFYGQNITEFYLVEEMEIPYHFNASSYWRDLTPVRALSHSLTGLSFNARDGSTFTKQKGQAYLSIDIGLLAVQYRHWWLFNNDTETQHHPSSVNQFVYQYPLVNLIESDIEFCFFNRLRAALGYIEWNDDLARHGLAILDLRPLTDKVWSEWLGRIKTAPRRFIDLPAQIPALFAENVKDCILIPDIFFNRQNLGIFTLAFLPYLSTLSRLSGETGSRDNGSVQTLLERWYHRFVIGNYLSPITGINPQETLQVLLGEVLKPLRQNP